MVQKQLSQDDSSEQECHESHPLLREPIDACYANVDARLVDGPSPVSRPSPATTSESSFTNDDDAELVRRHSLGVFVLCWIIFCDSYMQMSLLPYVGFMTLHLVPPSSGVTAETVGRYAGLLSSCISLGRLLTSYHWGVFADQFGRKVSLLISLAFAVILSVLFPLSPNFSLACASRFLMGAMTSWPATSTTVGIEMSHGIVKLEHRAMALIIGLRSWGFLICPVLGGLLVQPLQQYPEVIASVPWLARGWPYDVLQRFPFILPNLVQAGLCFVAMILVHLFIEETLPREQRAKQIYSWQDLIRTVVSHVSNSKVRWKKSNLTDHQAGAGEAPLVHGLEEPPKKPPAALIWQNPLLRYHLITQWMFGVVPIFVNEAFTLFAMSTQSGLAMQAGLIGEIITFSGLIYAVLQFPVYMQMSHQCGSVYKILILSSVAAPAIPGLIPWVLMLLGPTVVTNVGFAVVIGIHRVFVGAFLTAMSVAINQIVNQSIRSRTNGLASLGTTTARAMSSIAAGLYVSACYSDHIVTIPAPWNSVLIWMVLPVYGCILLIRTVRLARLVEDTSQ